MEMNNKTKLIFLVGILILPLMSALLGTFEKETDINLIQTCNNCTYCNLTSIRYPNGSNIFNNIEMTKDGTYYNYTLNETYTGTVGIYKYCYDCGNAAEKATGCINFEVTLSGMEAPEGQSYILAGIFIVVFGIACVFLWLSNQIEEPGIKIFFLLASFVFLLGSLLSASIIAFDSNLTSGVNTTITILFYALGLIFFVIFAYVMIRQTVSAIDLMRERKGYEPGF